MPQQKCPHPVLAAAALEQPCAQFVCQACNLQPRIPLLPVPAARRRTTQQVYIKGRTRRPAATHAGRGGREQSWLGACIIKYGQAPIIVPVQTPQDRLAYTTWLRKDKPGGKAELTGQVYRRIIREQLRPGCNLTDPAKRPPKRPVNLLHDRDPAHTSNTFKQLAEDYNINAVLLPPGSPDLDPLDYGVFGPAQRKLDKELELRSMDFEEQCQFLTEAIMAANTDAAIMQLPHRIQKCIDAEGWHFE